MRRDSHLFSILKYCCVNLNEKNKLKISFVAVNADMQTSSVTIAVEEIYLPPLIIFIT